MIPPGLPFALRVIASPSTPSRRDLVAFQNRQLSRLLMHAYHDVPYWRDLFDRHGLRPADVRTTADLATLPITAKRHLQGMAESTVVERQADPSRLLVRWTSGSTGEPTVIRRTWLEERLLNALRRAALAGLGVRARDRVAVVVRRRPTDPRNRVPGLRVLRALGWNRSRLIDCLEPPATIARKIREFRPDIVSGLAGTLGRVAEVLDEDGGSRVQPRLVVSRGELLTPLMRERIEQAFGAPVLDVYASHEFNLLACECPATGGYHVNEASAILEVVRDGRPAAPGERGMVVVTGLHSFAMPFIRYALGDVATRGPTPCPCGHPSATILSIQGRMIDHFPLPDGRLLHPYEIVFALRCAAAPAIRRYQVVQEREDRVSLRVVPGEGWGPETLRRVRGAVGEVLGPDVDLEVLTVSDIEADAGGKLRPALSRVYSDYDGRLEDCGVRPD